MANDWLKVLPGVILSAALCAGPVRAQTGGELKREIEALKEEQKKMMRELGEIKSLLREKLPFSIEPRNMALTLDGAPFKGDPEAKLTLIEFSDYQCPFCARHFRESLPEIDKDYIKTGKIKYLFRDFPVESIHPLAFKAAEAAHCAGEQEKFWEMHDQLFNNQKAFGPKELTQRAQALGLNATDFQQCLESGKQAGRIRKDMLEGKNAGIKGTPAFFLGLTEANGAKMKPLRMIKGAQSFATFKQTIESLLSADAQ